MLNKGIKRRIRRLDKEELIEVHFDLDKLEWPERYLGPAPRRWWRAKNTTIHPLETILFPGRFEMAAPVQREVLYRIGMLDMKELERLASFYIKPAI